MTKETWRALQVQLSRYNEAVMKAGEAELKKLLEAHAKKAVTAYDFDAATYAREMERIIKQSSALPAAKAQAIADKAINDAMIKAGVRSEVDREILKKKIYAAAHMDIHLGKYMTKPDGNIVYVPPDKELEFVSKYHLSGEDRPAQVWQLGDVCKAAALEKERQIMGIVRQGVADGIDPKTIAHDLEAHIKGGPVMGRWGKLKPDEKWEEIVAGFEADGYSPKGARVKAGQYYKEQGWERAPGSREYYARFGSEGVDYRAARLLRTEQAAALSNRQKAIALNNPAVDRNKVEIVLEQHRDAWHCHCREIADKTKGGKVLGDDGYLHEENGDIVMVEGERVGLPPYHPNCQCQCRPVLLSEEEFAAKILADLD
ncbi:MAG: hypothetical protein LBP76_09485 [Treponema sp.]|jgi:hypothetical protein|nr:hypothetical protein [Treponema sp.]